MSDTAREPVRSSTGVIGSGWGGGGSRYGPGRGGAEPAIARPTTDTAWSIGHASAVACQAGRIPRNAYSSTFSAPRCSPSDGATRRFARRRVAAISAYLTLGGNMVALLANFCYLLCCFTHFARISWTARSQPNSRQSFGRLLLCTGCVTAASLLTIVLRLFRIHL